MSNIGLELALRELGIEMVRCPVGDKYVMEEMIRRDLSLGGEQSGHVIFSEHLFTGDGLVTALSVVRAMVESGRELHELAGELVTYPQVLVNVRVRERTPLGDVPAVRGVDDARRGAARRAGSSARALLRHRAAAAHHDRGRGSATRFRRGRTRSPDRPADAVAPIAVRPGAGSLKSAMVRLERQRQQGGDAAQLARRRRAERDRGRARDPRGGRAGITVHPRADARHITRRDVLDIAARC